MKQWLSQQFPIERLTALVTWAVLAVSTLYLMDKHGQFSGQSLALVALLYLIYIVAWWMATRDEPFRHDGRTRIFLIVLQYVCVIGLYFLVPYSFVAILMVIWSGQIPYILPMRLVLLLSPLWSAPLGLVYHFHWDKQGMLITTVLFWTFNLFALVMVNSTIKERAAKEAASQLNRELLATQALLSQATRQAERLRIARNIHDLLGHHLTALTINLQVASRLSEGEARDKVEQCHGLAKLLLSDVREAVSEIREKSGLQLDVALRSLVDNLSGVKVTLEYDEGIAIADVAVAEGILRCVQESLTNSLKHGKASEVCIRVRGVGDNIELDITDNGTAQQGFVAGNGLKGMQERVAALGGEIHFSAGQKGFAVNALIPEAA